MDINWIIRKIVNYRVLFVYLQMNDPISIDASKLHACHRFESFVNGRIAFVPTFLWLDHYWNVVANEIVHISFGGIIGIIQVKIETIKQHTFLRCAIQVNERLIKLDKKGKREEFWNKHTQVVHRAQKQEQRQQFIWIANKWINGTNAETESNFIQRQDKKVRRQYEFRKK